jgi:hypothetical protein
MPFMRNLVNLVIAFSAIWPVQAQSKPHIIRAISYNTMPIEIAGRHYTASASADIYSNGAWECSFVVVFPADRYLVHSVAVEHGVTTFTAHGHTYRIVGRCIAITDHTAAWLKLLPGDLPLKAYADGQSLQRAVTKRLKRAHEPSP